MFPKNPPYMLIGWSKLRVYYVLVNQLAANIDTPHGTPTLSPIPRLKKSGLKAIPAHIRYSFSVYANGQV